MMARLRSISVLSRLRIVGPSVKMPITPSFSGEIVRLMPPAMLRPLVGRKDVSYHITACSQPWTEPVALPILASPVALRGPASPMGLTWLNATPVSNRQSFDCIGGLTCYRK